MHPDFKRPKFKAPLRRADVDALATLLSLEFPESLSRFLVEYAGTYTELELEYPGSHGPDVHQGFLTWYVRDDWRDYQGKHEADIAVYYFQLCNEAAADPEEYYTRLPPDVVPIAWMHSGSILFVCTDSDRNGEVWIKSAMVDDFNLLLEPWGSTYRLADDCYALLDLFFRDDDDDEEA